MLGVPATLILVGAVWKLAPSVAASLAPLVHWTQEKLHSTRDGNRGSASKYSSDDTRPMRANLANQWAAASTAGHAVKRSPETYHYYVREERIKGWRTCGLFRLGSKQMILARTAVAVSHIRSM